TIKVKPSNPSNQSSPTFEFSDGAGATFVCQLDSSAFSTCTNPTTYGPLREGEHTFPVKATNADGEGDPASNTWTIDTRPPPMTYGPLSEGTHVFSVRATDSLGHQGPATSFSWTIDLTPPPPPSIDSGPANPTDATNASFVFFDSEAGVTFGCQLDGSAFTTC